MAGVKRKPEFGVRKSDEYGERLVTAMNSVGLPYEIKVAPLDPLEKINIIQA
jgi:hypothetical protein